MTGASSPSTEQVISTWSTDLTATDYTVPATHSLPFSKSTSYPGLNFSDNGDSIVSGSNVKATSSLVSHFNFELEVTPLISFPLNVSGQS